MTNRRPHIRSEKKKRNEAFVTNLTNYLNDKDIQYHCFLNLCITFQEKLTPLVASRRLNRFWSRCMFVLFDSNVRVLEAGQRSKRVHYHIIDRGYRNHDLYSQVEKIQKWVRTHAPAYGIGPRSTVELIWSIGRGTTPDLPGYGIIDYLTKDLVNGRTDRLLPHARVINYSQNFHRTATTQFSRLDSHGKEWRRTLASYAQLRKLHSLDELVGAWGPRWFFQHRQLIHFHAQYLRFRPQLESYMQRWRRSRQKRSSELASISPE
jgi:hypothetical protein